MLIAQIIVMCVIALGLLIAYAVAKLKHKQIPDLAYKIVSIVLAVVFFFRFMLGDDAISGIFDLTNSPFDNNVITVFSLLLNWFLYAVILLVILYPFFKNTKYATIIKYFGSIVTFCCIGFIYYLTIGIVGTEAYSGFQIRTLLMGVELGILLAYCLVVFFENNMFKVTKSDVWGFAYIIGMLLATLPSFMLQALFGYVNYSVQLKDLTFPHRIILYLAFIIPVVLYFLLRKKDKETIRGILLYISLGTLLIFSINYKFADFADVTHWPFHLCNTAMYLIPLCLLFKKWDKLFYFTYFINVFGAFLAMVMPNYDESLNLFSSRVLEFYTNHFIAFFMPILMVALRVYERPKLKQFKYSMVGFGIYFLLVLILNAWFSNYGTVDYFFINSDFIADKLGTWAEDLMDIVWTFNIGELIFTFYPVYQVLFFIVYVILGAGVWFIYEGAYTFVDTLYDIADRKKKIKLDELALKVALNGRSKEEPMDLENKDKIVLKNFTKRYGNSKVYAVKDANLVVNSGDIFGFLGHNGAGKSTIIKSMVGIQPITSGSIEICGYDVDKQSVMAKKNIGYVPDHYALYEKLTGREYINYIADLYDVSQEDRNNAINKYVELFELKDSFDNQIKTYSHGMKQKIAIMSALVHNPKVWILDEPLTGLDPVSIYQVKECMRQHAKAGNIVFFSSHLIDIVESLCDKIAIIKRGKILTYQNVEDIEKTQTLEEFYLKVSQTPVEPSFVEEEKLNEKSKIRKKEAFFSRKKKRKSLEVEQEAEFDKNDANTSNEIDLILSEIDTNKKKKAEIKSKIKAKKSKSRKIKEKENDAETIKFQNESKVTEEIESNTSQVENYQEEKVEIENNKKSSKNKVKKSKN